MRERAESGTRLRLDRFDELFARESPYVRRVLRRHGVRPADVEDACQEVFLVVYRRLHEFEQRSSLRTWLYGICIRVGANQRRRAVHRREEPASTPPEVEVAPDQGRTLEHSQDLELLDQALAVMDPKRRDVFMLHELEDRSLREVAQQVGCRVATAYARLYAARRELADSIERLTRAERTG